MLFRSDKVQLPAESLLTSHGELEHAAVVVAKALRVQLLTARVYMDAADMQIFELVPLGKLFERLVLVDTEFAGYSALSVKCEVRVYAHARLRLHAVACGEILYALKLGGTVGNDNAFFERRVEIVNTLAGRGIINILRRKSELHAHRHLAHRGCVKAEALV